METVEEQKKEQSGAEVDYLATIRYILKNPQQLKGKINEQDITNLKRAIVYLKAHAIQKILEERLVSDEKVKQMMEEAENTLSARIDLFTDNLPPEFDASKESEGVPKSLVQHAQDTYNNSHAKLSRDALGTKIAELQALKEDFDDPEKFLKTLIAQIYGEKMSPDYIFLMNVCADNMRQKETSRIGDDTRLFTSGAKGKVIPNTEAIHDFFEIIRNPSTIAEISAHNTAVSKEKSCNSNLETAKKELERYQTLLNNPGHYENLKKVVAEICDLAKKRDDAQKKVDEFDRQRAEEVEAERSAAELEREAKEEEERQKSGLRKFFESLARGMGFQKKLPEPSLLQAQQQQSLTRYETDRKPLAQERSSKEIKVGKLVDAHNLNLQRDPLYEALFKITEAIFQENIPENLIFGEAQDGKTPLETFRSRKYNFFKARRKEEEKNWTDFSYDSSISGDTDFMNRMNREITIQKFMKLHEWMEGELVNGNSIQDLVNARIQGLIEISQKNVDEEQSALDKAQEERTGVYNGLSEKAKKLIDLSEGKQIQIQGLSENYVEANPADANYKVSPFVAALVLQVIMDAQNLTAEDLAKYGIQLKEQSIEVSSEKIIQGIADRLNKISSKHEKTEKDFTK